MREPGRTILHIDMDAFYASVEQRDHPSLRGVPVIVGGHEKRGVVLAASYEVRTFGVRSAMPMVEAVRRAPKAVVVPPRFDAYVAASEHISSIFREYTPLVEPLSLDEAFLDVTASRSLFGEGAEIAKTIRMRIRDELGLPSSAGIAPVKFAAKLASDLAKPDGQLEVPANELVSFLAPLPVSRLWGVGQKAERVLSGLGLRSIGDIAARNPEWLSQRLGSTGSLLYQLSRGIDPREVVPDRQAKSIGAEDTFEEDLPWDDLPARLLSQALRVGRRLRRSKLEARCCALKLKYTDFKLVTRRRTLSRPTNDGQVLYSTACELLSEVTPRKLIRLTGISASELSQQGEQLSFDSELRKERLNRAIDSIAAKFANAQVLPAALLSGRPRKR